MARLKPAPMSADRFDNASNGRSQVLLPKGVYRARVVEMTDEQPEGKGRRIHVIYEISKRHKNYAGTRLHDYITLKGKPGGALDAETAVQWKLDQFMIAVGLAKKVGKTVKMAAALDTDKPQALPEIQVRVVHQNWDRGDGEGPQPSHKVGSTLALAADDDADEETADEPEDDEDEDEDEDEEDEDDAEDEGDDLDEMGLKELRVAAKEAGLATKGLTEDDLREKIRSAREESESEDEDEDDDAADTPDYTTWKIAELTDELVDRGEKVKLKKYTSLTPAARKKAFIARLEELDAENPFEDDEDE